MRYMILWYMVSMLASGVYAGDHLQLLPPPPYTTHQQEAPPPYLHTQPIINPVASPLPPYLCSTEEQGYLQELKNWTSQERNHIDNGNFIGTFVSTAIGIGLSYKLTADISPLLACTSMGISVAVPWILDNPWAVRKALHAERSVPSFSTSRTIRYFGYAWTTIAGASHTAYFGQGYTRIAIQGLCSLTHSLYQYVRLGVPTTRILATDDTLQEFLNTAPWIYTPLDGTGGFLHEQQEPKELYAKYIMLQYLYREHVSPLPNLIESLKPAWRSLDIVMAHQTAIRHTAHACKTRFHEYLIAIQQHKRIWAKIEEGQHSHTVNSDAPALKIGRLIRITE